MVLRTRRPAISTSPGSVSEMQSLGPLETRSCIWTPRFGDLCAQWSGQVLVYNRCFHLVTVDTWGWVIVCVGCCPVHCRCLAPACRQCKHPQGQSHLCLRPTGPESPNWKCPDRLQSKLYPFLVYTFEHSNKSLCAPFLHWWGSFSRYYLIKPISVKHIFDNGYKVLSWTMVPEI